MATLQLSGVGKTYPNGDRAVVEIDLALTDGELFTLVGPSGCGKTTLLRMIAGLERPTTGTILIDGEPVDDVPTVDRDIAMAFQEGALYPHRSAADNIAFPLEVAGIRKRERRRRAREIAELLDLTDVLDVKPHRLSGGQRQRVALGRSIIRRPRLLLMDEPLSSLDAKLRVETRSRIMRLQRAIGVTTVFVTHDQIEAMAMGDRVGVMRRGRLVQVGRPMDVYRAPDNLFVARFMGSPPMNLFCATIVDTGDGLALDLGRQLLPLDPDTVDERPRLRRLLGRLVAVGLRPEAVRHDEEGPLTASVDTTRRTGSEQLVAATLGARSVADWARAERPDEYVPITAYADVHQPINQWRGLRLSVDTRDLLLFDPETGLPIDGA